MLKKNGITTAAQFRDADDIWVNQVMTVNGLRLVQELSGFPCWRLEVGQPPMSADYTSSATITTTCAVKIFMENIGSANASFSYAGLSYTLLPGEQRSFAVYTEP